MSLFMFDFFKSKKSNDVNLKTEGDKVQSVSVVAGKSSNSEKIKELKGNLAKISNSQNRDYDAEAKARPQQKIRIADNQPTSYNFGKQDEFPNLYKGWIRSEGDQIAKQFLNAAKKAIINDKIKYVEILFDPVPNLDEVAFGTTWNQRFRKEDVCLNLVVPDYAANRGGSSTLEWANIYWANRLAEGLSSGGKLNKIVALSLSGEGIQGKIFPSLHKSLRLMRYSDAIKPGALKSGEVDCVIIISPCQETHYSGVKKLADDLNIPAIALNAPYSYRYDVGGGEPFELIYAMKRIPKGWIFRSYPRSFEAVIEGPEYEMFQAKKFDKRPSLPEISKVSMQASTDKYGSTGNDRIFQNRL